MTDDEDTRNLGPRPEARPTPAPTPDDLESGEWEGRAGAYAIQGLGGRLVERIDGARVFAPLLASRGADETSDQYLARLLSSDGTAVPVELSIAWRDAQGEHRVVSPVSPVVTAFARIASSRGSHG